MTLLKRAEDFRQVQDESRQAMAILRRALFSLRLGDASSPVQGRLHEPPSPLGGSRRRLVWAIRTNY
jgi:hypothetical protein